MPQEEKRLTKNLEDTGSAQAQERFLTQRIKGLTSHFRAHKKDFHSMRGLMKMVSRRKKLVSYIKRKQQGSH